MTPNKLPPLPVPVAGIDALLAPPPNRVPLHPRTNLYTADQMHAYAAEALRQSQSLPAGAVAGLVEKWREDESSGREKAKTAMRADSSEWWRCYADTKMECANHLEQALQADAREKGEAWTKDAEEFGDALNEAAWAFTEKCPEKSGLLFNNTKVPLRAAILKYAELVGLATQPAQASEKDNG